MGTRSMQLAPTARRRNQQCTDCRELMVLFKKVTRHSLPGLAPKGPADLICDDFHIHRHRLSRPQGRPNGQRSPPAAQDRTAVWCNACQPARRRRRASLAHQRSAALIRIPGVPRILRRRETTLLDACTWLSPPPSDPLPPWCCKCAARNGCPADLLRLESHNRCDRCGTARPRVSTHPRSLAGS
jgi:hypothetical protein